MSVIVQWAIKRQNFIFIGNLSHVFRRLLLLFLRFILFGHCLPSANIIDIRNRFRFHRIFKSHSTYTQRWPWVFETSIDIFKNVPFSDKAQSDCFRIHIWISHGICKFYTKKHLYQRMFLACCRVKNALSIHRVTINFINLIVSNFIIHFTPILNVIRRWPLKHQQIYLKINWKNAKMIWMLALIGINVVLPFVWHLKCEYNLTKCPSNSFVDIWRENKWS